MYTYYQVLCCYNKLTSPVFVLVFGNTTKHRNCPWNVLYANCGNIGNSCNVVPVCKWRYLFLHTTDKIHLNCFLFSIRNGIFIHWLNVYHTSCHPSIHNQQGAHSIGRNRETKTQSLYNFNAPDKKGHGIWDSLWTCCQCFSWSIRKKVAKFAWDDCYAITCFRELTVSRL